MDAHPTPMQALKNSFDRFKSLMPAGVMEAALNKSEDKVYISMFCGDREEIHSKGVRSDFIKVFKGKGAGGDPVGLGFSFAYLNRDTVDFTVQASVKTGRVEANFISSARMGVDDFRPIFEQAMDRIESAQDRSIDSMSDALREAFAMKAGVAKAKKATARRMRKMG